MRRVLAMGASLATTLALPPVAWAASALTTEVVQGEVLQLISVQDTESMGNMRPGVSVSWDVAVSANQADGVIDVALESTTTPDAFSVTSSWCTTAWQANDCPTGAHVVSSAPLADGVVTLASFPSAETRHFRVSVELTDAVQAARADLTLRASGMGDEVTTDGEPRLPDTGSETAPGLLMWASAALLAGCVLVVARRRADREGDAVAVPLHGPDGRSPDDDARGSRD